MNIRIILATLGAALVLVGCGGRVNVQRDGQGGFDVSVALTEADVNAIVTDAVNQGDGDLHDVTADLQNGQIVLAGTYDRAEGNSVNGTITLTASVSGDLLDIEVLNVDIEGFDANDEQLARLNERIENGINRAAERNDRVSLTSVTITDDELTIAINVQEQGQ